MDENSEEIRNEKEESEKEEKIVDKEIQGGF